MNAINKFDDRKAASKERKANFVGKRDSKPIDHERLKVVICAEYQGEGAVNGNTTGFQRSIEEWVNQAGIEGALDIVVYCVGTSNEVRQHGRYKNVTIKQYKPNLSIRDFAPVPAEVLPFLIDTFPIHLDMIKDMMDENPNIIHTFQTFGSTDLSGYVASRLMKKKGRDVRLINTVITEIDTYFANYIRKMISFFYQEMDLKSLPELIRDSAKNEINDIKADDRIPTITLLKRGLAVTFWYGLAKLFEITGHAQDKLIAIIAKGLEYVMNKSIGKRLLRAPSYQNLKDSIKDGLDVLRRSNSLGEYKEYVRSGNGFFFIPLKTMQLAYDYMRRGDLNGFRGGFIVLSSNSFRLFLGKVIPAYLKGCDDVIVSRPEDLQKYNRTASIWELPLACDLNSFRLYDPDFEDFFTKIRQKQEERTLSRLGAEKLEKLFKDPNIRMKRSILYVGRLSYEKNISLLMDAYEKLLEKDNIRDKVHFVFIGAGVAALQIEDRFKEFTTVTGLVPNSLLPDIYNFVRQKNGFFISASDTETFGITHLEAAACGVPLIAMQRGTRGHFYVPGDTIGDDIVQNDIYVINAVKKAMVERDMKSDEIGFITALNGLCIPDYSKGRGLSIMTCHNFAVSRACDAIFNALYVMASLEDAVIEKMSTYANRFVQKNKMDWSGTWQLLRYVYNNNRSAHQEIMRNYRHIPIEAVYSQKTE